MRGIKNTVGKDSEQLAALDSWNKNHSILYVCACACVCVCVCVCVFEFMRFSEVYEGRSQWP